MTAAELIANLPASVRVGAHDFRLEKWSSHAATGSGRWAECAYMEFVIRIQENIPQATKAVEALLHEISHAIWWVYRLNDDDKEERVVSIMGMAWTQVYRDNPWLIEWIALAIKPKEIDFPKNN